jgi:broad specificity phosphatase PhoE
MSQPIRLYLIRHGRPLGGFGEVEDPGLDEVGLSQAKTVAQELYPLGPLPIISSPLQRARETARPFESQWGVSVQVEHGVAEIPSPTRDLRERAQWIYEVLRGRWRDLPMEYQRWRENLTTTLLALPHPTVVTTHFVAINAAVGVATNDDRMVCFEPDHCSCTVLEVREGALRVATLGRQRATLIH